MSLFHLSLLALCLAPVAAQPILAAPTATASVDAPQKHPLKGVIAGVLTERQALLVKHEEIPGVMRAMTMVFRVDAETLAWAKAGDAIEGMMFRQDNTWWLENVRRVDTPAVPR